MALGYEYDFVHRARAVTCWPLRARTGMTVLVTHIERKTLDPLFRALLMKQFTVDDKGQKTIRVGEMEYAYHPDFCLYLSTQSPLFLKGQ